MILTSKFIRFHFDDEIAISKAKLIRDTIIGEHADRKFKTAPEIFQFANTEFGDEGRLLVYARINKD